MAEEVTYAWALFEPSWHHPVAVHLDSDGASALDAEWNGKKWREWVDDGHYGITTVLIARIDPEAWQALPCSESEYDNVILGEEE